MAQPLIHRSMTDDEYLALERRSDERHEFFEGQVYAMAGESPEHNLINANLIAIFVAQLKGGGCRTFSPNMKVRTGPGGLYSYPDLAIVCDEPALLDEHRDVLLNPVLIAEVLSPSTEAYDRGKKFLRYQRIHTLTDYLLVAQDEARIEHFVRKPNGHWDWSCAVGSDGLIKIASVACEFRLSEIYGNVVFAVPNEESAAKRQRPRSGESTRTVGRKR